MDIAYRLHYAPDNASLIIRLALEALGVAYETVLVDRSAAAQKSPAYLALNPNGLIPVLETPDGPIFETGAILLWLADRHAALFPAPDSSQRAEALKWLFFLSNTLHTTLRMSFYSDQYVGDDPRARQALGLTCQSTLRRHLDILSQTPLFCAANPPGILHFYLACLVRWAALYPVGGTGWFDLGEWPPLYDMLTKLEDCPATRAAINAEGLGPNPFTAPRYAQPPEGSAT